MARVGGVLSVALLVVAVQQGTLCPFCLASQLGNLVFVLASERLAGAARATRRPALAFLIVLVASSALLFLAQRRAERERGAADEAALASSTEAIAAATGRNGFVGRHPQGPERAAIRLVLFTDYQCDDCRRIEGEALELLRERADLSLSLKHFPLCKDCNRAAREQGVNLHPNACWAARAAEAAGMVAGGEAFWAFSAWLFARKGAFVEGELRDALASMGLGAGAFLEAMHGPETLARVQADVDEALALGIQTTPMVFLNGVELRGWRAPSALRRAVEALAARAPTPGTSEADRPPGALEKGLDDWRLEPVVSLPARAGEEARPGTLEIVLWSDYLEPSTRELDRRIRALLPGHPGVRYAFRNYPLEPDCNSGAPRVYAGSCLVARAAEAARRLLDPQAFARFHAWLMEARRPIDEARLREGARGVGLDGDLLLATLAEAGVLAAVRADADAARRLGIHSIPFLFLGGRRVARWKVEGGDLLERLLETALSEGH